MTHNDPHLLDKVAVDQHKALLHQQIRALDDECPLPLRHESVETTDISASVQPRENIQSLVSVNNMEPQVDRSSPR